MAAHALASVISCHAWNGTLDRVALCPNNNEASKMSSPKRSCRPRLCASLRPRQVHIYQARLDGEPGSWQRTHVLKEHDQAR